MTGIDRNRRQTVRRKSKMANITPEITHYANSYGESLCGLEASSDWEEDDDAEFWYTWNKSEVDCKNCLKILKET